jgi:hypothetical protein
MKKILACSALALGSIVAIQAQTGPVSVKLAPFEAKLAPLEVKIVTGQPYSAEIVSESIQTLADGNRIVQRSTGRVFRDGQGRVRREEDRPSGVPSISIMDPTAGVTITLDPVSRTAREMPNGLSIALTTAVENLQELVKKAEAAKLAAARRGADGSAQEADQRKAEIEGERRKAEIDKRKAELEGERRKVEIVGGGRATGFVRKPGEKLDEQTEERLQDRLIEGVWASGVRRTTTFVKGAIGNELPLKVVSEEWMSPDLQILVSTDRNDPRTGRSTYRLLRINRNDPDPTLFEVPADYTVQRAGRGGAGRGIAPR